MVRPKHFKSHIVNFNTTFLQYLCFGISLAKGTVKFLQPHNSKVNNAWFLHRKDRVWKERTARNNYDNWQNLYGEYKTVGTI